MTPALLIPLLLLTVLFTHMTTVVASTIEECTREGTYHLNSTIIPNAEKYVYDAYLYVDDLTQSTPHYTDWFGTFTPSRHSNVTSNFNQMANSMFQSFDYQCIQDVSECKDPSDPNRQLLGKIDPNQHGVIYLCPSFWEGTDMGTDSKAGTLVSLSSQFIQHGGAQMYASGQANCQELARTNPDEAIHNADSYRYFAENTPPLE